ncbi:MAG TPA: hypothetical protein VHF27_04410 [Acidimicrobiales bacterium]|nr:hypothetical protein [Acidimicrobiales bacterium]
MRRYQVVDGRPRTVALIVGSREMAVDGPEVALTVDGRRITDADLSPSQVEESADRLTWMLFGQGIAVRVVVERGSDLARKRVEVSGRGHLTDVELDRWAGPTFEGFETTGEPVPYNEGPVGLGQPVFGPGFFAGVEHPAAENLVGPGGTGAALRLPVAVDLGPDPWASPGAVVGGGHLDEFWDYVDGLRPNPPRAVVLSNNWYHLGATARMDEASVRAEVEGFDAVAARHGLALDFVVLDDGWEGAVEARWDEATGLWGGLAPSRFPSGIGPLGPRVGLWLSPFGGYGERQRGRVAWARAHGLEVDPRRNLLCAAGTRYRAHLAEVLARWTGAGVGYWKLDGVSFDCADPGHGHPVGPGARTAQVDAFRGLVEGIRAVRHDAVVIFTIGSHPSPWWLSAVDFVWRGGLDDTAADQPGSRLDRFDTYVDTCLQRYRPAAFPLSALVTFSFVEAPTASYRNGGTGLEDWARHCWLAAGRGTLHHDLYVAPDSLSDEEWRVLADALAWARGHERVLARSRMVLGDPGAGEVYGFAARKGDAATACLRNPSPHARTVDVDWPALLGFPAGTPLALTARHGPSPDVPFTLGPFEVLVLEATA